MSASRYQLLLRVLGATSIAVGIAARVYQFNSIPAGLNQDEAITGYDAWSLLHFGTDGDGVPWPVHVTGFGSGAQASYAYMAIPFIALGLSPFTLRLPMLISGLASLILVWIIAGRLYGEQAAWGRRQRCGAESMAHHVVALGARL